jgi:hypothetical protein
VCENVGLFVRLERERGWEEVAEEQTNWPGEDDDEIGDWGMGMR